MNVSLGIISRFEDIINSPLNFSKSKYTYTFPKAQRFRQNKILVADFYDIPEKRSSRTTTFGYGTKQSFDVNIKDKSTIPSPQHYLYNNQNSRAIRISFSCGRDKMVDLNSGRLTPGPGQYNNNISQLSNISYSMRQKMSDIILSKSPGPGAYRLQDNIKFRRSFRPSITSSQRASVEGQFVVPGPGSYDIKIIEGLSKYQSHKSPQFSKSARSRLIKYNNPGPGNYQIPSEFGHYGRPRSSKSNY